MLSMNLNFYILNITDNFEKKVKFRGKLTPHRKIKLMLAKTLINPCSIATKLGH